ncbi:MAG: hypothetical protein N3D20_02195 [Candidatus Pacearchaeota archaeon]|nr:hypothetical protein [Candidatus Pacearchaeota archaeon]
MIGNMGGEKIVEAIENGKIVRVSESYAKREGLLVLRVVQQSEPQGFFEKIGYKKSGTIEVKKDRDRKMIAGMDDLRRPLRYKEGDVTKELVENFHWKISQKRRERGLTRKQVALAIGESENDIKIIENGVLPANNFILVSKLENYLGLNLRKDKTMAPSLTKELNATRVSEVLKRVSSSVGENKENKAGIIGSGIKDKQNQTRKEPEVIDEKNLEIEFSGDEIELIGEDKQGEKQ